MRFPKIIEEGPSTPRKHYNFVANNGLQGWQPQKPQAKHLSATPPTAPLLDVSALAVRLEGLARKGSEELYEVLMQYTPDPLAKALLRITNDARVAQILMLLDNPEDKNKMAQIFFWIDLLDTSIQNDSNRRDRIEKLMQAPMLDSSFVCLAGPEGLKSKSLRALAHHVDRYGWVDLKKLGHRHDGVEIRGLVTEILPTGEERPMTMIIQAAGAMQERWTPPPPQPVQEKHRLQAQTQFPDDPRGQELALQELEGTLSVEDKSELMAKREFPYNPRGRELAVGERAEMLSSEEKEELRILRQKQLEMRVEQGSFSSRSRHGFHIPR